MDDILAVMKHPYYQSQETGSLYLRVLPNHNSYSSVGLVAPSFEQFLLTY